MAVATLDIVDKAFNKLNTPCITTSYSVATLWLAKDDWQCLIFRQFY